MRDIGRELREPLERLTGQPVRESTLRQWNEVPGPGENLKGAGEAIRRRVTALVEELLAERRQKF